MNKIEYVASESNIDSIKVQRTIELLDSGCTIPFIARYRKEKTGALDEVEIASIRDYGKQYDDLIARQKHILKIISEQGKLEDSLESKISNCFDPDKLEDLYLPYKVKKSSKAEVARKKGLEPLAKMIMSQRGGEPEDMAERFLKGEIYDVDEAINGAIDIMCEWINENEVLRDRLRDRYERRSILSSKIVKGKENEAEKFKDYFDHSENLNRVPAHRFLAIYRGHREKLLSIKARPEDQECFEMIERFYVKGNDACSVVVSKACTEAYRKYLRPSLENEALQKRKKVADQEAIKVFATNLRKLLLESPLGNARVLAIDPGFRTGCKVVCLDEHGTLLTNATIYPHAPQKEMAKAKSKISQLVETYKIEAIAIGDGTAGRETEHMIKHIRFDQDLKVFVVREDGASIYSASSIARKEFPQFDVTVRGAVSIGRRLMDPLSELVKIDPKSLGVGQYQHEVDQALLKDALDDVVISAVNEVGVDINIASPYLLSYVAGLGPSLAENIVNYRKEHGSIQERSDLLKVPRLGSRAYEQAAGFIRIRDGVNPLDNSSVHPESYRHVENMAAKLNVGLNELIGNDQLLSKLNNEEFPEIDSYTFDDLIKELKKPGRDPRQKAKVLEFDHRLKSIDDVIEGMTINGIVTNVTNFGAFVNIGIKENGLIHKSNLADQYVEDPSKFISLHEHVTVQVLEVDKGRKRIGLKRLS